MKENVHVFHESWSIREYFLVEPIFKNFYLFLGLAGLNIVQQSRWSPADFC